MIKCSKLSGTKTEWCKGKVFVEALMHCSLLTAETKTRTRIGGGDHCSSSTSEWNHGFKVDSLWSAAPAPASCAAATSCRWWPRRCRASWRSWRSLWRRKCRWRRHRAASSDTGERREERGGLVNNKSILRQVTGGDFRIGGGGYPRWKWGRGAGSAGWGGSSTAGWADDPPGRLQRTTWGRRRRWWAHRSPPPSRNSLWKRVGYLEDVKREPFTEPKQDRPTNTGMIHAMGPRWWLPKSCKKTWPGTRWVFCINGEEQEFGFMFCYVILNLKLF